MQNTNFKRITAWIALTAIVFVMLLSAIYISEHINHECAGEECSVCAEMEQCYNNINNIGTIAAVVTVAFFLCLSIKKGVQHAIAVCTDCSLISQKVRMNN